MVFPPSRPFPEVSVRRTALSRPRPRIARPLAPIGVLALVTALAAGCGDDGNDDAAKDDKEVEVVALTEEQIAEAVLQPENLGEDWESEPSEEDDETAAPGCFADIDTLTEGLTKVARGGNDLTYSVGLPTVESTISAYDDEIAIAAVFDQVQTVLEACPSIVGPDGDGNEWDLTLETTDEATYDADDQFSASASGTFTQTDGNESQIYIEWTSVRVGPNVGSVTTIDIEPRADEHAVWTQIAVDRLNAVIDGEEPAETTAPAPA